jgi:hypothetical protein
MQDQCKADNKHVAHDTRAGCGASCLLRACALDVSGVRHAAVSKLVCTPASPQVRDPARIRSSALRTCNFTVSFCVLLWSLGDQKGCLPYQSPFPTHHTLRRSSSMKGPRPPPLLRTTPLCATRPHVLLLKDVRIRTLHNFIVPTFIAMLPHRREPYSMPSLTPNAISSALL